jgi:hypothetical protein
MELFVVNLFSSVIDDRIEQKSEFLKKYGIYHYILLNPPDTRLRYTAEVNQFEVKCLINEKQ